MAGNQQFCLRWNNHQCTLISVFDNLLESGTLVDCTLAAEGQYLKAHKVVLSACSPFFEGLFSQHPENHPIIILKDVTFGELKAMLDYMYRGEVNISQDQLGTFLKAAESLQIKGLTDQSSAHGNGDLYRKAPPEPRRIIVPPISKSPIIGYPAGQGLPLVVEPRPPSSGPPSGQLPVHPGPPPLKLTNNNVDSPPRRKRRLSDDEPIAIEGAATQQQTASTPIQAIAGAVLPTTVPPIKLEQPPPSHHQAVTIDDYFKFKQEHKSDASVNNDDSGEEGGGGGPSYAGEAEDDDEEEEMDLSKPGTSTTPNSHPPGGWNESSDNTSTEQFTPGGSQEQEKPTAGSEQVKKPTKRNHGVYPCEKCGRTYIRKDSLQRHTLWECGKDPLFQCPFCPQRCKRKSHHIRHIQRQHKDMIELMGTSTFNPDSKEAQALALVRSEEAKIPSVPLALTTMAPSVKRGVKREPIVSAET